MYCPNCGANNKKQQNYCRFCGLHLPDIEKLYLNQLVFGAETKQLKNLRKVRKLIAFIVPVFFALIFAGGFLWFFYDHEIGRTIFRIGIFGHLSSVAILRIIEYFQRQMMKNGKKPLAANEVERSEFTAKKTDRLIEEKPFYSAAASVTENTTELLFAEREPKKTK